MKPENAPHSINQLLNNISAPPDIWGEGALFAYSGIDGQTNSTSQFVATLAAQPYGLLIHTAHRRYLDLRTPTTHLIMVTSDVIAAKTNQGLILTTFLSWHTIIGLLPPNTSITLAFENYNPPNFDDGYQVTWDDVQGDAVVLYVKDSFWSLAYGTTINQAKKRARLPLSTDTLLEDIIIPAVDKHLAVFHNLPYLQSPGENRFLKKCISVMKANTLSSEKANPGSWSTPDRVPHRHMWLWDSVFHSFGMNYVNPELAWAFLKSVLECQLVDGMIPHMMCADGTTSHITQPPILAWGVWENYCILKDKTKLAYALPKLEHYLTWNLSHRDSNNNHLLEWNIEANPLSRSGESGMDNSQRFDGAIHLDAVDFSVFQVQDMHYIAEISETLGEMIRAKTWRRLASKMSMLIHTQMWDAQEGFYFDRTMDGKLSRIKAVSGFLPLLLNDINSKRVRYLVQHLDDPTEFNTIFPIPSVSIDTPDWSTDMWRGATWINMNYLVIEGLRRQGQVKPAARLKERTLHFVAKYYLEYGVIFEFYDAKDGRPPIACDRKGPRLEPYNIQVKMDSIRDYHWSAALVAQLLLEE